MTTKAKNASTGKSPCLRVWEIAEQMKGKTRKEVIAACVAAGITYYTARTQYQHYITALRNSQ